MARLLNQTQNKILISDLEIAQGLSSRMKGLLGKESINNDYGLWIKRCNSIHTFMMAFPIDLIFVDKNLKVKKCIEGVQPNRVIWPVLGANSVFELNGGALKAHNTQVGDQLHVDS